MILLLALLLAACRPAQPGAPLPEEDLLPGLLLGVHDAVLAARQTGIVEYARVGRVLVGRQRPESVAVAADPGAASAALRVSGPQGVLRFPSLEEAFQAVENQRADAAIAWETAALQRGLPVAAHLGDAEPVGILLRKSDTALAIAVHRELAGLIRDGSAGRLSVTWFHRDIYKSG